jgi:hypothetical protein
MLLKLKTPNNPNPLKSNPTVVDKIICLAGFHSWYEYEIDFFNPRNVREECSRCGTRRLRFDKRKYRRTMWNNPNA